MDKSTMIDLLKWFSGRVGDHLPNDRYQRLFMELANDLAELAGLPAFADMEAVLDFMYPNTIVKDAGAFLARPLVDT